MDISDKSLIEAHLRGDSEAFGGIVRRYGNGILGYLTKICNNRELAEDLFQETFKRAHEKLHTVRGSSLRPWLFKIATNVAINQRRKQQRRDMKLFIGQSNCNGNNPELTTTAVLEKQQQPFEEAVSSERKDQVRKALFGLPDKQRTALILVYYQYLSYREAAEALDCCLGTVKTHIYRALRKLAKELPDIGDGAE